MKIRRKTKDETMSVARVAVQKKGFAKLFFFSISIFFSFSRFFFLHKIRKYVYLLRMNTVFFHKRIHQD